MFTHFSRTDIRERFPYSHSPSVYTVHEAFQQVTHWRYRNHTNSHYHTTTLLQLFFRYTFHIVKYFSTYSLFVDNQMFSLMYTFSHSVMCLWCILNNARGGLVLSYGTFSPTRLLNYCCFMTALYVIIIGQ